MPPWPLTSSDTNARIGMIDRGSLWLPLVILAGLAGMSFWIERTVQSPISAGSQVHTDPEGIMENFKALRTDAEGRPQYRLDADRLKHYSDSKRTEIEAPRFVYLDTAQGTIHVHAKTATVSPEGDEIDLVDDVHVRREAHAGQSPMVLRTARLLIFPERHLLRAPERVSVEERSLVLTAGAMEYHADRRILNFSGRVEARYLANTP